MVVSPSKGTFVMAEEVVSADRLGPGARIGDVGNSRGNVSVTAAHGGEIVEWLVEDGDLVSPGQPLLRLHPNGGDS